MAPAVVSHERAGPPRSHEFLTQCLQKALTNLDTMLLTLQMFSARGAAMLSAAVSGPVHGGSTWRSMQRSSPRRPRRPSSRPSSRPRSASNTQVEPEHLLRGADRAGGRRRAGRPGEAWRPAEGAAPASRDAPSARCRRASTPTQVHVSTHVAARCSNAAQDEAERLKDDYISTEHFLLALADDQEKGKAGQLLRAAGVTRDRLYQALQEVRGGQRVTSQNPETHLPGAGAVRPRPDQRWPARASSIRSSAATRRSGGSSRC